MLANDTKDVLMEEDISINDFSSSDWFYITAPYRDQYYGILSLEGYFESEGISEDTRTTDYGFFLAYYNDINFEIFSEDINFSNWVEIKFVDKAGNLIYPGALQYFCQNTEGRFEGRYGTYFYRDIEIENYESGAVYYIRYDDKKTMGIRPVIELSIEERAEREWEEWEEWELNNVYPITPDQNGVAYITLSDYDIEHLEYRLID